MSAVVDDITVIALRPEEMPAAQAELVSWVDQRIAGLEAEKAAQQKSYDDSARITVFKWIAPSSFGAQFAPTRTVAHLRKWTRPLA